jgi:ATP-dependent DNA ligase
MTMWIRPMLAKNVTELPAAKDGGAYWAEPKIDGERLCVIVADHKTIGAYSRTGRMVLNEKPFVWLKEVRWPLAAGTLDGEAYAGDGTSQAQANAGSARSTAGVPLTLALFDYLRSADGFLLERPLEFRRAALEEHFRDWLHPRVQLTPTGPDPAAMWQVWVDDMRGEGLVLKARDGRYYPGKRTLDVLKWKKEYTVEVVITGVAAEATYTKGGYRTGEVALTYGYWSPSKGEFVTVGQGVMVGSRVELEKHVGRVAESRCAGVMPSGALRHQVFRRWRDDRDPKSVTLNDAQAAA